MVLPADPPAPMTAEANMEDAKMIPGAAEEATKVAAVISEEETNKKPGEDREDPKAAVQEGEDPKAAVQEGGDEVAVVQKSSSYREESNFLPDLKEHERKALVDLRAMVEEAILANKLFPAEEGNGAEKEKKDDKEEAKSRVQSNAEAVKEKEERKEEPKSEGTTTEEAVQEEEEERKEEAKSEEHTKGEPKSEEHAKEEAEKKDESKEEAKSEEHAKEEADKKDESKEEAKSEEHAKDDAEKKDESKGAAKSEELTKDEAEKEGETKEEVKSEERTEDEAEIDVALWGVPLLGSKRSEGTDVVLLKFLRAQEFKAKEAFEMLRSALQWRKDACIDSILEESLGEGLEAAAYMDGTDREGHPVCYNVYGVFQDAALYERAFGSEEKVEHFLRWRFQLMEKGIRELELRPGGVASILQITDLKDSPGISKREIRAAMKRAVGLLQDNYPEFVAKNIFINVPFWYYAFNSLLSPFLTQRTKSKFVFARPAKVTETLLKYIPAEDIPARYGGLKRENDTEFSVQYGGVYELVVRSGAVENVEIPVPEAGTAIVWDLTVVGWEVNYKEEFVPTDEGSYTILLQKGKKMGYQEEPVRNSFRNSEPGKVVLIIENNTFWRKKILYRYKAKRWSS